MQKPGTLPDNMEVILNTPALRNIKSVATAPNLNRAFNMNPQYIRSSTSHSMVRESFNVWIFPKFCTILGRVTDVRRCSLLQGTEGT